MTNNKEPKRYITMSTENYDKLRYLLKITHHKSYDSLLRDILDTYSDYDKWFLEFLQELAKQSGTGVVPQGIDKSSESYINAWTEGISPAQRASQELDDLSR